MYDPYPSSVSHEHATEQIETSQLSFGKLRVEYFVVVHGGRTMPTEMRGFVPIPENQNSAP